MLVYFSPIQHVKDLPTYESMQVGFVVEEPVLAIGMAPQNKARFAAEEHTEFIAWPYALRANSRSAIFCYEIRLVWAIPQSVWSHTNDVGY